MSARSNRRPNRPVLTGRALGLGALVVLLVVVLASPVHRYFASRADVNSASRTLHDDQKQLAELTKQKALYGDPGFIQREARAKLSFAMPGDTVFVVVGKGAKTQIEQTRDKAAAGRPDGPWNDRLWNSVRAAGR